MLKVVRLERNIKSYTLFTALISRRSTFDVNCFKRHCYHNILYFIRFQYSTSLQQRLTQWYLLRQLGIDISSRIGVRDVVPIEVQTWTSFRNDRPSLLWLMLSWWAVPLRGAQRSTCDVHWTQSQLGDQWTAEPLCFLEQGASRQRRHPLSSRGCELRSLQPATLTAADDGELRLPQSAPPATDDADSR